MTNIKAVWWKAKGCVFSTQDVVHKQHHHVLQIDHHVVFGSTVIKKVPRVVQPGVPLQPGQTVPLPLNQMVSCNIFWRSCFTFYAYHESDIIPNSLINYCYFQLIIAQRVKNHVAWRKALEKKRNVFLMDMDILIIPMLNLDQTNARRISNIKTAQIALVFFI